MAKKYTVKDINKNGKIDGWEQGKYDAINKSATNMKDYSMKMGKGYSMKMGHKEIDSPTNFKTKDALNISAMPMTHDDEPGGASKVGQKVNGKTITFDPSHSDLNIVGRFMNRLGWHGGGSQSRAGDYVRNKRERGIGAKKGDVNRYGETYIGFNFSPPKNKVEGKTIKSGIYQYGRPKFDGDTIFNDANQDGTMLGRFIQRFRGSGVGR